MWQSGVTSEAQNDIASEAKNVVTSEAPTLTVHHTTNKKKETCSMCNDLSYSVKSGVLAISVPQLECDLNKFLLGSLYLSFLMLPYVEYR